MEPLLHPSTKAQIQRIAARPKGAYLFVGPTGVGRVTTAYWLAKLLHCGAQPGCQACHLIDSGAYGDLIVVDPRESGSVGIAQIQEVLSQLSKSRIQQQGTRMVIIDQADRLTVEAQNSLLKTIEEPPESTMVVLILSDPSALLETVQSRSEPIFFAKLSDQTIADSLEAQLKLPRDKATQIAAMAMGAYGIAVQLAQDAELLGRFQKLEQLVSTIETAPAFNRLLIASQLQEQSADMETFLRLLGRRLQRRLRTDQTVQNVTRIQALERFERFIKANVNGRSAWSQLLLEL